MRFCDVCFGKCYYVSGSEGRYRLRNHWMICFVLTWTDGLQSVLGAEAENVSKISKVSIVWYSIVIITNERCN